MDGAGVSGYDFILYVSARQSECGSSTQFLAFAGACQMEATLDRPISGFVNFCPDGIAGNDDDFVLAVTKHEILHAILFSRFLFPFWRYENGDPRTTRDGNGRPPVVNG